MGYAARANGQKNNAKAAQRAGRAARIRTNDPRVKRLTGSMSDMVDAQANYFLQYPNGGAILRNTEGLDAACFAKAVANKLRDLLGHPMYCGIGGYENCLVLVMGKSEASVARKMRIALGQ